MLSGCLTEIKLGQKLYEAVRIGDIEEARRVIFGALRYQRKSLHQDNQSWTVIPAIIDYVGPSELTPLHSAACEGREAIARLLLSFGADPLKEAYDSETPLHKAVFNGHTRVVEELLQTQMSPDVTNVCGETPLHYAVRYVQYNDAARALIKAGADVNKQSDINGWTPLHWAANMGNISMVQWLVFSGANPEILSKDGKTVLDVVTNPNLREDVAQALRGVV